MVLTTENTAVETPLEGKTFQIEDNVVLYNILSDRMYRNKVRAVIRELSTNAVDAHIEAGNTDTPIKVQLPTILEPTFSIRDYGIGLSADDVMNLYTTYGSSTKRNSNMFNGALGLGSKSPFAYAKAFSVTSYFNGMKYMFSVYSDNGMPKIAKLGEQPTDEPNGLHIEIPTNDEDVYKFEDEARFVYKFFDFEVECNKDLEKPVKDREATIMRDNWAIYNDLAGSWLVMANVAYNLKNLELPGCQIFDTEGLVVWVSTGDVQFSASREELSLTPETTKFLTDLAQKIEAGLREEVVERVGSGEATLKTVVSMAKSLPKMLRKMVTDIYPSVHIGYYGDATVQVPAGFKVQYRPSWSSRYERTRQLTEAYLTSGEYLFVLNDVKNRMAHIKEVESKKLLFVTSEEEKTKDNAKSRFDAFIKELGLEEGDYAYATDYELPPRAVSPRKSEKDAAALPKEETVGFKEILKYEWDGEQWVSSTLYKLPDGCLDSADYEVFTIIEKRDEWLSPDDKFLGRRYDKLVPSVLKFNDSIDKNKVYLFVKQNPSQYKKYKQDIKKFWTELLPKRIKVIDVTKVVRWFKRLGIELNKQPDGTYRFANDVPMGLLPKDLVRFIDKMNKSKHPLTDNYYYMREINNLKYVANSINAKCKYEIIEYKLGVLGSKYDMIYANISLVWSGHSAKKAALLLNAWDKSYKRLLSDIQEV